MEKRRDSLVFFRSWYEAIKELPRDIQGEVYTAIMEYGLNGITTENLKPIARSIFTLIKPALEYANKQFSNGSKGGRPRNMENPTETQPKPNRNPTETQPKPYKDKDNIKDNIKEEDSTPLPPRGENGVGVGFEVYGKFGNVQLKPMELRHLYETYGEKLTKDAIEDLSCHLADGTQQSVRHYATLELWLKHRSLKQRGGDASYKGDSTIGTEFTRKM